MKLLKFLSIIFLVAGIGCLIAFNLVGGEQLYNGAVHEPFYLVIFGVGLLFASLFIFIIDLIIEFFDKKKSGQTGNNKS
jgi:phosphotransferase system  glucose/maltose/N-acetylglucosamine-specific IIC component